MNYHPEFVIDEKANKKAVIIPFSQWQHLMEEIEELEDIRAYDKAKDTTDDIILFEKAVRQIKKKNKK